MEIRDPDKRYNVEAVERFAEIVAALSQAPDHLTAREIAVAIGIPERSATKILVTMCQQGLLMRTPANRYALGFAWLRMADLRRRHLNIRDLSLPVMRQIRDQVNETIILCVRAGTRRIHVDYAESTQAVRRVPQTTFSESPLHVGSAGRTLLAGMADAEIEDYLAALEPLKTAYRTITDRKRIWRDIERVRADGYLVALSEITKDTASVSAPIKDYAGRTLASLTLTCPLQRFDEAHKRTCVALISAGARRVSNALGFAPVAARTRHG